MSQTRRNHLIRTSSAGICLVMMLASCATPDPAKARDKTAVPGRGQFTKAPADSGQVQDNWLASFRDPTLPKLVKEAQANNPDLTIASGRVDEARARAMKAGAALSPQVNLAGAGSTGNGGAAQRSTTAANLGLNISWELDVWGRLRQGQAAATQDALSAAADYEFARQSLAAQVAEAWFFAIASKRQAVLDADLLAIYEKTLQITTARKNEGVASQMDVDLAGGNVSNARQALARSEGAREDSVRSLEALLGRYPGAELEIAAELPAMPAPIPTGLPSEVLERRPDVIAADRQVAAAFFRTGSAKAAKLPTFGINGNLGAMINPSAAIWSIGANLLAPVYDGGQRKADVAIAEGQQKQSLGNYVRVALNGFREVETAMANEAVLQSREAELLNAAERYGKARKSAEVSYKEGAISLVDLNSIQAQDSTTRADLIKVQSERLRQRIKLHLALGGSFENSK